MKALVYGLLSILGTVALIVGYCVLFDFLEKSLGTLWVFVIAVAILTAILTAIIYRIIR